MTKEKIISTLTMCAKLYEENLRDKNMLLIYGKQEKVKFFESEFEAVNFLHLTGVTLNNMPLTSKTDFYNKCLRGQLSPKDISIPKNGTVEMKMQVLPHLMIIHNKARMICDFDFSKTLLMSEKIVGNTFACLGYVKGKKGIYYPNTALKEDVRDVTRKPQERVLVILRKQKSESTYLELCYVAKGVEFDQIRLPKAIADKIDILSMCRATFAYAEAVKKYGVKEAERLIDETLHLKPIKMDTKGKQVKKSSDKGNSK